VIEPAAPQSEPATDVVMTFEVLDYDDDALEICENCRGTGVDGYDGDPDSDLPDQWDDLDCSRCDGTGLVT